ncbi:hypothetical protein B296_00056759 [Ensete ventricosum]|uniref:Uncharacterized protein n=1 Tax=Ensete ventricosum TaxID=4639 RepID=A0A426X3X1_ENSVE|nr:hypothetical protein B296_00056759 [Ensete ventricosum]
MSTCGNCDCADKSQCVKKGNGYAIEIVVTEKRYYCPLSLSLSLYSYPSLLSWVRLWECLVRMRKFHNMMTQQTYMVFFIL